MSDEQDNLTGVPPDPVLTDSFGMRPVQEVRPFQINYDSGPKSETPQIFCLYCFKSIQGIKGRIKKRSKRFCSEECRALGFGQPRCKPSCSPKNIKRVWVTFKNGTTHLKETCRKCFRGSYAPREDRPALTPEQREQRSNEFKKKNTVQKKKFSDPFYQSTEWMQLRYEAIAVYGHVCMNCKSDNGSPHVDHIKPVRKHPELKLEISNLQVLCRLCNWGKNSWDETDFRTKEQKEKMKLYLENKQILRHGRVLFEVTL